MVVAAQNVDISERAHQMPKHERITTEKTPPMQRFRAAIQPESMFMGDGLDSLSSLDSKKFSWLSPASTVSASSSPAASNDIWDAPETPSGKSSTASCSILTPLTPATPPGSSEKLFITPISKLSFGVEAGSMTKQQISEKKDLALQDDSFRPSKLFRNFTFELEAIAQKNVASASVKYDINPSFVFTSDPVSSRTRSKTHSKAPVASVVHAVLSGGSNVRAPQYRTTPSVRSAFGKLLDQIIPHDLHARLVSRPGYCVASLVTRPSDRCTKSKGAFRDIGVILKKLTRCKTQEDYYGMLSQIEELVKSVMCGTHKNTVLKQLQAGSRMAQLRSRVETMTHMSEVDRSTLRQWVDAICDLDVPEDHIPKLHTMATNLKSAVKPKSTAKPKPRAPAVKTIVRVSFSSNFLPYEPRKSENLSVSAALYQEAASPLSSKALTPGFIYLYWDKEYFGKVKIGYTNNLARRLEEWNKDCKRENAYHSSTESQVEMPHVYRVEQLIHTELKDHRLRRKCEGCGKMHKEWFEANEVHVVKVLKKWREWILQKPYVQDKRSGEWVIRPEMLDTLELMCEPLPQEVSVQRPRRRSGGPQRTPQKNNRPRRTI